MFSPSLELYLRAIFDQSHDIRYRNPPPQPLVSTDVNCALEILNCFANVSKIFKNRKKLQINLLKTVSIKRLLYILIDRLHK